MDGGVRRLVVDVTGTSDGRDVAYAFVRCEYAFEGISEDIDGVALHPPGPFIVCAVLSQGIYRAQFPGLGKRELSLITTNMVSGSGLV